MNDISLTYFSQKDKQSVVFVYMLYCTYSDSSDLLSLGFASEDLGVHKR